jgi:molecular chaperone GrpE
MTDERTTNGEINEIAASGPEQDAGPRAETDAEDEEASPATMETLRAEVARVTDEAERNWQQFLRAAAELENYRKQAARQRDEAVASTRRTMLGVILSVVDTLERALQHAEASQAEGGPGVERTGAIADGIRLAHRQVLDVLRSMDVRPMEAMGRPFDPRVHDAVEAVPASSGDAGPGVVVGEVQRGYMIGNDVLRPARVRVAQ